MKLGAPFGRLLPFENTTWQSKALIKISLPTKFQISKSEHEP